MNKILIQNLLNNPEDFTSEEICASIAEDFTKETTRVVSGWLSEDYKIGFKEGVEKFLEKKGLNFITDLLGKNVSVTTTNQGIRVFSIPTQHFMLDSLEDLTIERVIAELVRYKKYEEAAAELFKAYYGE
jgi:hypothetical protein